MTECYQPESDFLKSVIADEVPLSGSVFAEANLRRLIAMTRDPDRSNRDWAALLLSQQDGDTPEIRAALLEAARDEDEYVRAEALCGLAARDPALALPLLQEALAADSVALTVFEAAALAPHPSLVGPLRAFTEPSANAFLDRMVLKALAACEASGDRRT
ncbi:MAG TPA: HEAT repeat domain-containing protein [Allosphingosinicella sp.]|jgi:HEAT repeat protein